MAIYNKVWISFFYEENEFNVIDVNFYACHFNENLSIKGIFSDSSNIFLWHESEDINKKNLFPKFQLIQI